MTDDNKAQQLPQEMFEMRLSFDGVYMTVTTPEVSLHWDGVGSLIVGVSRDTQTLGLCGSNRVGEQLRGRFRRRRYHPSQGVFTLLFV